MFWNNLNYDSFLSTWLFSVVMVTDQTAKAARDVILGSRPIRMIDTSRAWPVFSNNGFPVVRCYASFLFKREYDRRSSPFLLKMSGEIDDHITEKYEVKKRLGKGVGVADIVAKVAVAFWMSCSFVMARVTNTEICQDLFRFIGLWYRLESGR